MARASVGHSLPISGVAFLSGIPCDVPATSATRCFQAKRNNLFGTSALNLDLENNRASRRVTFTTSNRSQPNHLSRTRILTIYQKGRRDQYDYDDNTNDNILVTAADQISSTLSIPTPVLGIPLGYPLSLLMASILLPFFTSVLLNASFGGYLYLGRQLAQIETYDDEDNIEEEGGSDTDNTINLVALAGAIASAGLLSPAGFGDIMTAKNILGVVGTAGIGLTVAILTQSFDSLPQISPDEELMDSWDKKFKDDNVLDKK
mmetsp:Transcript_27784/g.39069  ORF Transcript_27784/g.39069 Transcript_27784/m.39069 type:complete len:261 (-) Transcript_27784:106-888(-)